jgi:aryl-alcohol dehydrogenase-like predicted oxidoreductase
VLSRGADIIPLIGARRRTQLDDAVRALDLKLSTQEFAELEKAIPPDAIAGTRYDENQMRWLDSERKAG